MCPLYNNGFIAMTTMALLLYLDVGEGYSTGAPDSTCDGMTPSHSVSAQSGSHSYSLTLSTTTYSSGSTVTVTLAGGTFKGFLIEVRSNTADYSTATGSFTTDGSTLAPCSGKGITHNENSDKTSKTMTWTAPTSDQGTLTFVGTIVQDQTTFWTGVTSTNQLTWDGTSGSGSTTTNVVNGQITKNSGCGISVGCYTDCVSETDCSFQVTWLDGGGNTVTFSLAQEITGDSYVALGLSSDFSMGDDSVTECVSTSSVVAAHSSYNPSYSNSRLATSGITLISSSHSDGVLTCTLTKVKTSSLSTYFDLNSDWYLMLAYGSSSGGALTKHSAIPQVSSVLADFQSFQDISPAIPSRNLLKAHGIMMSIAWIFTASIGIVIARHFKSVWTDRLKLCGLHIWFQLHVGLMIATVTFTALGFILIFVYVEGYVKEISGSGFLKAHPVMGIIVMCLVVLNVLMGVLRPGTESSKRFIFNIAHTVVGGSAGLLAVLNLFSGSSLTTAQLPGDVLHVLYVFVAWQLFILILLEAVRFFEKQKDPKRESRVGLELEDRSVSVSETNDNKTGLSKYVEKKFQFFVLIIHFAMVTALMIAISVFIGSS